MSKPTLFFSHSSKDKDMILSIRNKLDNATGGAMDIFMSSDGQSIPFGTNWIHKIEEGLQVAKIMFIFVTENSISSGWIYFEAGYAYSKGIQVIPVGIGIDIGALKAPLSLLQGFNITSEDSLNNFISIINKAFDYRFPSSFENKDYVEIISKSTAENLNTLQFEKLIDRAECTIYGVSKTDNETVKYDFEKLFSEIITYLDVNEISYSRDERNSGNASCCVVANGVKILYWKERNTSSTSDVTYENCARISFSVSPYNFQKAFTLLNSLLKLLKEEKSGHIKLHLKEKYSYITSAEDGSSIISSYADFDVDKAYVGGYVNEKLGLRFYIFDANVTKRNSIPDFVASVVFDKEKVQSESVVRLIEKLYDIGFIYEEFHS